jgi:zinc resistance-associated protein
MKSRLPIAFTLIALVAGVAAQNASAQQGPPGAPVPPPSGSERHGPPHWAFSPADHAAFVDARIAALHAGLKLTPDQEKLWPPVEAALRAGAKSAHERHEKLRGEAHTDDLIAFLRRISEAATARGETLKAIADAAAPLYATLTEDQKHRLPILLHKPHLLGGHFGPHEGPHGWHGGEDEPEGFGPHGDGPHDQGPHEGGEGPHEGWDWR